MIQPCSLHRLRGIEMIELTGITWDHPRGYGPLSASETPYETACGVRVRWHKRSLKDFGDAPVADLARHYDLVVMDHPHIGVAAEVGCLHPLEQWLSNDRLAVLSRESIGASYCSYNYNGHQWALPLDAACQVSARRPDLYGPPRWPIDWDEVFELRHLLDKQEMQMGMALCPTDALCSFLTLCAQFGDAPVEGRSTLVEPSVGLRVLDLLRQLRDASHPDSLQWNPIALFDEMARSESRVAYAPLAFGYSNYARTGYAAQRLCFGCIPGRHSALLGGAGLALSAHCAAPEAAAAYIAHICSAEYQSGPYIEQGGQPANGAAYFNSTADANAGGYLSQTRDTLEQAYMRPRHPLWPTFQESLGEQLHQYLSKDTETPEAVLKRIDSHYAELLRL